MKGENLKDNLFFECGCCGQFHPIDFEGDCRDDNNRFTIDELFDYGEYEIYNLEAQMEMDGKFIKSASK